VVSGYCCIYHSASNKPEDSTRCLYLSQIALDPATLGRPDFRQNCAPHMLSPNRGRITSVLSILHRPFRKKTPPRRASSGHNRMLKKEIRTGFDSCFHGRPLQLFITPTSWRPSMPAGGRPPHYRNRSHYPNPLGERRDHAYFP